ncbi:hypothetical protein IAQ61_005735 [Plenodomus lingam]|uniref:uncharacterized protein n=1 Tax=Leptosphaeria maculans TaxID=5022 RepID=UPI00332255A4|nr:hypothetical protein IAQ61_005735 [Plenodomus lingam]
MENDRSVPVGDWPTLVGRKAIPPNLTNDQHSVRDLLIHVSCAPVTCSSQEEAGESVSPLQDSSQRTPIPSTTSSSPPTPSTPEDETCPYPLPSYQHNYIAASITSPTFWSTSAPANPTAQDQLPVSLSPPFPSFLPKPPRKDPTHASHIDVLVHCAGIAQASLFTRTSEDDIEAMIATNLTSVMRSTRFLLRHGYLRKQASSSSSQAASASTLASCADATSTCTSAPDAGQTAQQNTDAQLQPHTPVIINIASVLGILGGHGAVAYAASKAGVLGFTRALASEYTSHGVRVNAVLPGYVETGMTRGELNLHELKHRAVFSCAAARLSPSYPVGFQHHLSSELPVYTCPPPFYTNPNPSPHENNKDKLTHSPLPTPRPQPQSSLHPHPPRPPRHTR